LRCPETFIPFGAAVNTEKFKKTRPRTGSRTPNPRLTPVACPCSSGPMSRLSRYLVVQFSRGALALFLVAAFLVWFTQMLRIFDLVTAKGQGMLTLAGQALLTTAPLALQIIYICLGIGMARAFRSLQQSHELHIIHISRRIGSIWSAVATFVLGGMLIALFFANFAEPMAKRAASDWSAKIAVDLLGRTLTPGRFTEISPGLVLFIGGRDEDGTIRDFFASDSRNPQMERTYIAQSAVIVAGPAGFQVSLRDGQLQVMPADGKYSEIVFSRYDLSIESLTQDPEPQNPMDNWGSWEILTNAWDKGGISPAAAGLLNQRMAEGVRVLGISVLIAALVAFPHSRRGREFIPPELSVLVLAFAERFLSNTASASMPQFGFYLGPVLMIIGAMIIFSWRLLRHRFMPAPRVRARAMA